MSYCERCHLRGSGCCRTDDDSATGQFGLTRGEIDDIMRTTGMQADQFTVSDIADPRFLLMLNTINPSFRLTMPEGRRIRLKVTDHRCVFLTPAGCSLPVLVRPIYCRVYPFWFDSDGRLLLLRSHRCLAQQDALSPYDVMHRLEMSEPDLRELFDRWLILARDHSA